MTNKIKKRYNRVARFYDILDKPMEMALSKWRGKLLSEAKGNVLEVGIGTGKNIPYYSDNVELTGIDFSPKMVEYDNLLKAGFEPQQIEIENVWLDIVKLIKINNIKSIIKERSKL